MMPSTPLKSASSMTLIPLFELSSKGEGAQAAANNELNRVLAHHEAEDSQVIRVLKEEPGLMDRVTQFLFKWYYAEELYKILRTVNRSWFNTWSSYFESCVNADRAYAELCIKQMLKDFYNHFKVTFLAYQDRTFPVIINTGYPRNMALTLKRQTPLANEFWKGLSNQERQVSQRQLKQQLGFMQQMMSSKLYYGGLLVLLKNLANPKYATCRRIEHAELALDAAIEALSKDCYGDPFASCLPIDTEQALELFVHTLCQILKVWLGKFPMQWLGILYKMVVLFKHVPHQRIFNDSTEFWSLIIDHIYASWECHSLCSRYTRLMFCACFEQFRQPNKDLSDEVMYPIYDVRELYELMTQMVIHFPFDRNQETMITFMRLLALFRLDFRHYKIAKYFEYLQSTGSLSRVLSKLANSLRTSAVRTSANSSSMKFVPLILDPDADTFICDLGCLYNKNGNVVQKIDGGWFLQMFVHTECCYLTSENTEQILLSFLLWIFSELPDNIMREYSDQINVDMMKLPLEDLDSLPNYAKKLYGLVHTNIEPREPKRFKVE